MENSANKEITGAYEPKETEGRIYQLWQESGFFNPDNLPTRHKKPFTIIMPPPNANGSLHLGHVVFVTLQDIMTRFERMRGKKALWLPGADHAGFETQVVYDKKLDKEGRNRFQIPRDDLYKEIYDFTQTNKKIMENQLRKLGASCDWSREMFTLDPRVVDIVYDTFEKLYNDELVYRSNRIINWCAKHQTSLSDLETVQNETADNLYYLKYGPFTIATARPETKFGDKYVIVHPKDKRYAQYKDGQQFQLEWINGPTTATLIKDPIIDMSFGTGAMTITPWHDSTDFEIAERHNLPKEQIIDWGGKLLAIAGEFSGMHISKARPLIVEKLKAKGLLIKTEEYKHSVPACYKCKNPIEPQIRPQWYIAVTKKIGNSDMSLRDMAINAVKSNEIKFVTKKFEKIFFHWMKNLRDWNISRQVVWGIQIPMWYCEPCTYQNPSDWKRGVFMGKSFTECPSCGEKEKFRQDTDVFDTWFSSGQWPFASLRAQNEKDFKTFYPTDVIETGWDILLSWVARMIMLGMYATKKPPFKTVYLHGLVRDQDRQKMSKSKGNVIDPLGVGELYGTDAVRMSLVIGQTAGNDIVISEEKIKGYRNFGNKIWNASRFVLMHTAAPPDTKKIKFGKQEKEVLAKLKKLVKNVTKNIESYKFHHAGEELYHFFWHYYADEVIEAMKPRLAMPEGSVEKETAKALLLELHTTLIKLLHPFMPFLTEAIWQQIPLKEKKLLIVEEWPA